ncbi:hypothetical protein OIU84_023432 [Salix udensis]|uniref:Uncharacterized protein n=1 Tax=Salix udensis TaxID=889485 RepID=A0AAD6KR13_9ROSI|nr:hypothetical protein OIU84_023432 [Salix udensis]
MRIRNSQTSFPIPLVPQAVLRSTHFRSQFQHFDERFVVEEENRRIGWPYYPVRKHLSSDVQKVRPHDGLHSAIASEIKSSDFVEKKTGKENSMPAMQSHVINLPFLPAISPFMDLEGRTSNSSAASRRSVKGPRFSASVVLALSAPCAQPARGKKVYRKQKELPLKKRKKSRKLEIERTQAEKEEAATVKQDRTKEAFNKDDTSQKISWWRQLLSIDNSIFDCEGQTERGEGQGRIQCISQWQLLVLLPSRHGSKLMQRSARPHMK